METFRLRATLAALAAALAAALCAASPAGAVVIGVSENNPELFADPRFVALGAREARMVVPWNTAVTASGRWRSATRVWLALAARDGVTPLVSFGGTTATPPTVAAYTRAVRRFVTRFPTVRRYTAWNEPDWIYRPRLAAQPRLAAAYYDALSAACPGCLVIAGDLYEQPDILARWVRVYAAALHHRPRAWALHDYYDVRHHTIAQLRVLLRETRGEIWLDETGGVENRRHWRLASPAQAAANERFLLATTTRYSRVSRIYHYQWQSFHANGWDSALIGRDNRPRPAYTVLARYIASLRV